MIRPMFSLEKEIKYQNGEIYLNFFGFIYGAS